MKTWAKIEDGRVVYPPKNDSKTGTFNVDKNKQWLAKHGFSLMSYEDLKPHLPQPEETAVKYSTLKIIRALGDDWEAYRAMMQQGGVLDQFYAANYLRSDDPVFSAFIENVPEEVKARLNECLWEE